MTGPDERTINRAIFRNMRRLEIENERLREELRDRRDFEIPRLEAEIARLRRIEAAARLLEPWLKTWEKRGVGPDIQALIDALENR